MDGLDAPFVLGLRAGFFRDDPYSGDPLPVRDTTGTAGTAALAQGGTRNGQHNPIRRYPWDEAYPALRRLMARSPGRNILTSLEYRNPLTGGPALATLSCLLEGLPAGASTRPRRETASSVIVVVRGTATLICGGQTLPLMPNDVAAIPAWTWHQLAASDRELVLLRLTDRPIHDAFGLFQAEEEV
jgi:gentisate 1,2-dioxygenase